eukprot:733743_1
MSHSENIGIIRSNTCNDLQLQTADIDLSQTDSTSITIPKSIDLKIKTHHNESCGSMSTIASSVSSSSSSTASAILHVEDEEALSPLTLSQHSSPNFTFTINDSRKNKRSSSVGDFGMAMLSDRDEEEEEDEDVEDTRSASQPPPVPTYAVRPFSISRFIVQEIECIDTPEASNLMHFSFDKDLNTHSIPTKKLKTPVNSAEDRIYNFFFLFFIMERLLFFGFWICCDSFLSIITILPTRVLYRLYSKLSYLIRNEWFLFYHHFARYYLLYACNSLKYCFVSQIKRLLLFIICCRRTHEDDDEAKTTSDKAKQKNNEYQTYFDNDSGFCCKVFCIVSCCCVLNRDMYYNKHYEEQLQDTASLSTLDEDDDDHNTSQDAQWLVQLKQETYDKRMEWLEKNHEYHYSGRDYLDIIRLCTLILCVFILTQFNLSQIYHYIRAQENFKLYVLFKIIVIIQHLFSAFGEDCIDALFNSLTAHKSSKIGINLVCYVAYNIIHSLLLYGHLITLNAAMNSPNNTLITILVADNFYELKSHVFKRYYIQNVFQMACGDIVERFTIFLFVLLILFQNLCYLGWDNFDAQQWFIDALKLFLIMIGFEMVVDTVKHGFICRFNDLSINVYKSFYIRLSMDLINARKMSDSDKTDKLFFMDRRLGFASLPLVTLFLRIMWQLSEYNTNHSYVKATFIVILFIILYVVKLTLSLIMIAKSVSKMNNKDKTANELSNVRRYALFVKRIPV